MSVSCFNIKVTFLSYNLRINWNQRVEEPKSETGFFSEAVSLKRAKYSLYLRSLGTLLLGIGEIFYAREEKQENLSFLALVLKGVFMLILSIKNENQVKLRIFYLIFSFVEKIFTNYPSFFLSSLITVFFSFMV